MYQQIRNLLLSPPLQQAPPRQLAPRGYLSREHLPADGPEHGHAQAHPPRRAAAARGRGQPARALALNVSQLDFEPAVGEGQAGTKKPRVAVAEGLPGFCPLQRSQRLHFLPTLLVSICLTAGTTFSARAAPDTTRPMPTLLEIVSYMILAIAFAVAIVAALIVIPGHYGFKSNPVLAEKICYSLGVMLIAGAASAHRLPATIATVLTLAAGALTYYISSVRS